MYTRTLTRKTKQKVNRESTFIHVHSAPRVGAAAEILHVRPNFFFFCETRLETAYLCPLHQHREFEVILVLEGAYDCRLNGVKLQLPANSALVVQPGDWHEDFCSPPLAYVGLRFTLGQPGPVHPPRFFRNPITPEQQWSLLPSTTYLPLLEKITAETAHQDPAASHIQDALLSELFWRLVRTFDPQRIASGVWAEKTDERFKSQLHRCFAQNIAEPLPLAKMAESLGMSQRTLTQTCARLFQISPARAFLRFRVQRGQELLASTKMSVKEVSYRLGFANPYHFSRVYKKIMGSVPSDDKDLCD